MTALTDGHTYTDRTDSLVSYHTVQSIQMTKPLTPTVFTVTLGDDH